MSVEAYTPKFSYIETSLKSVSNHPDLSSAKVLEVFGGNGFLLDDPDNVIKESNYVCIDSDEDSIAMGSDAHPSAEFRFFDRFNPMINPLGKHNEALPIKDNEKFDVIVIFMKGSNQEPKELYADLKTLHSHLTPGGCIIVGLFVREVALNYFVVRRSHEYGSLSPTLVEDTEKSNFFAFINNDTIISNEESIDYNKNPDLAEAEHFTWFWNNDYFVSQLRKMFPEGEIGSRRLPPMWSIHNPFVIRKKA